MVTNLKYIRLIWHEKSFVAPVATMLTWRKCSVSLTERCAIVICQENILDRKIFFPLRGDNCPLFNEKIGTARITCPLFKLRFCSLDVGYVTCQPEVGKSGFIP